jgi:tyrosyl-tRNA synthetase
MAAKFKSDFLNLMSERGHLNQCTDLEGLDQAAKAGTLTGYIGYDATASSLHVGNLATIMMLRRLQQTGHKPITLAGGGTTKVGDPSDKTGLRQMRTTEEINANIASQKKNFAPFLHYGDGPTDAMMVNNADWLDHLEYIPFLRDVGRHFTINRMVTFDFVKRRLEQEQPLTFLEFNYMIMQGYDFVELNRRHGCTLQMGGADQWGNIVNGVELGRRINDKTFFGLTTSLITTSSGVKMGKTVNGAMWLDPEKLSPYDYWQFWRNTEDADVGRFMRIFTDIPLDEIARLEKLKDAEINEAKKILAHEATKLCHGEEAAQKAEATAKATFEAGGMGGDLPVFALPQAGASIVDILVGLKFCTSKGEAKRMIEQGGVKLDDKPIKEITAMVDPASVGAEGSRLSAGKKRHAVVKRQEASLL